VHEFTNLLSTLVASGADEDPKAADLFAPGVSGRKKTARAGCDQVGGDEAGYVPAIRQSISP
ncbi:MAG: hypothetical protein LIQ30_06205, partial [Planctomycetes bacterium]|nr:hypothetical protein [Planctomycetota bacterium]